MMRTPFIDAPPLLRPMLCVVMCFGIFTMSGMQPSLAADNLDVLRQENLVAWCIVPFDAKRRGPAERATMLKELGIARCAYDWRAEHVSSFEQEILEYRKHGIEFFAFWAEHEDAFQLFAKYDLHPQIWRIPKDIKAGTNAEKVEAAVQDLLPLADRTKQMGCQLGLYNHGGWSGEPASLVAVCERLRELGHAHVGIVYNFHHGHDQIQNWPASFELMKPYLICLNLNGMNVAAQPKILGIGKGPHELDMIRTVVNSDYKGPIGIIDHREQYDARESLQENLTGLEWIKKELRQPGSGGPKPTDTAQALATSPDSTAKLTDSMKTDTVTVASIIRESNRKGDALRGAAVFANAKLACLSCHRVGEFGGSVGPDLSSIAKQRSPEQIVESVLWPGREIKPEYLLWKVLRTDGAMISGYQTEVTNSTITLRDPATGSLKTIAQDEIENQLPGSTVMPSELTAAMSDTQRHDLFRFLMELGRDDQPLSTDIATALRIAATHEAQDFPLTKEPLDPSRWTHAEDPINSSRLYDFYAKQAEHFRTQPSLPVLLSPFPGLDGGKAGHWGKQTDLDWADARWNETDLGTLQAGVFHADGLTIPRGVCVRLGDEAELATCFNPDTLAYEAVWTGGFLKFSDVRHGFMHGLQPTATIQSGSVSNVGNEPFEYHGFYRHKNRVIFAYRIGEVEYLDSPWVKDGMLTREVAPVESHSLRQVIDGGPVQWPQVIDTRIVVGDQRPYAIDTIELPKDNPWKALIFPGDHDFLSDGTAVICTMQGDVWRVEGLDSASGKDGTAHWKRYASGLHQALGLVVANEEVYVQGRDQITRLVDKNQDGEADFYECFSNAFQTSPAGHDFICGLQRDEQGNFYTASGSQGLVRISPDGKRADVIATGFRNPDGLGILPDGTVTVPCSEGEWTPASMICAVPARDEPTPVTTQGTVLTKPTPHYGYRGPVDNAVPKFPLAYLPRGLDNSSGGQAFISKADWGPFQGKLAHFSFGIGSWFLVLTDHVAGQSQGAVVPMAGDFSSGAHRGRFRQKDGQLYVSGMAGWGAYTPEDGCFQRIRFTGAPVQAPIDFHLHENGVRVTFAEPIDEAIADKTKSHFAQCWNYRYSGAYGSPEFSPSHHGVAGHDPLVIQSVYLLADRRSLFLEIPELQPVSQLHLRMHVNEDDAFTTSPTGSGHDLFITAHKLDTPFTAFPGYVAAKKFIAAHPLLRDVALNADRVPNPFRQKKPDARTIKLQTGRNLTFAKSELQVKANELIEFVLVNPDVVPHNWVLVQPETLSSVGELANQLIADPEAFARQYIPRSDDVIVYTDIVSPGERQAIYFNAPSQPGRYPFLCTFPGHWMVMNGVLIVE